MQQVVASVVGRTFNRICVDACESTNDSVFVLASGREDVEPVKFESSLEEVCADLAEQMMFDAEGGTKVLRLRVTGAVDEEAAVDLGKAVASSVLWRSAVYGGDPNWGRILSALGVADRSLDLSSVRLAIGDEVLFADGNPCGDMAAAAAIMQARSYEVSCRVGDGPGAAEVLTTDLSPEYVTLNAGGLS
jgi:glutamate N-acetyltransferase/amino-acid N-acetyltransferase